MLEKLRRMRRFVGWLSYMTYRIDTLDIPHISDYKHTKIGVGTLLSRLNAGGPPPRRLADVEFQVFSQFGDDGIIQYLVHSLPIGERTFIEFGVERYVEANTRFLLVKDKWKGMVLDGSVENVRYIRDDPIYTAYDVHAEQAFISAENVNALFETHGFTGKIGLLSIDIDGMDYWVWRAVRIVDPAIVVIEYNSTFGPSRPIVVPYDATFLREKAHSSRLYYGASLAALQHLGQEKGYTFIGCNGNGNNAYFVRDDLADLPSVKGLERQFVDASFTEYRIGDRKIRGSDRIRLLNGMQVHNVVTGATEEL